jgi:nucleoside transporter
MRNVTRYITRLEGEELAMNMGLRARLSLMMFLQYFIWGAWYVTLGTWLATSLKFSGQQIGWAAGTTAIGAIISPFLVGVIADKSIATQKVLGILHGLGAVLLIVTSYQSSFLPFYIAVLIYSLCYMPTLALTNALAFRQMREPKFEFGPIRLFGTIGWIVAGLVIGNLGLEATEIPMRIAAGCSLLLAIYCFTLPHTPPLAHSTAQSGFSAIVPREALTLLKGRSMAVFAIASLLICVPLQFYYAFTNLFLNESGVVNAASKMTGGQMSEIFCMLLIPWFFRRLGVKYMLAVGMLAWVVRYVFFAYGNSSELMWMFWAGIILHGICFDFFFVVGQIYIDRKAPPQLRAATQGLITLITYGVGMLLGSWLSGAVVDAYAHSADGGPVTHEWTSIWLFAAACAGAVLLLFLIAFQDREADEDQVRDESARASVAS